MVKRNICRVMVGCLLCLAGTSGMAATVVHYRFEDSPGFTNDTAGTRHLANSGGVQYTLPGSGQGSDFPNPVVGLGASNAKGADFDNVADVMETGNTSVDLLSSNFTIEAFFNMDTATGGRRAIAAQWDVVATERSWMFSVEGNSTLSLYLSDDGSGSSLIDSGLYVQLNDDYYAAASFDVNGDVVFYIKNLTRGRVMTSRIVSCGLSSLNCDDRLSVSGTVADNNFVGVIDEVRLSDVVLSSSELLLPETPVTNITFNSFYYRFEDSPGFLLEDVQTGFEPVDASGSVVVQYTLPGSGQGSGFADPVLWTGAANAKAADFDSANDLLDTGTININLLESNFTAEAFINYESVLSDSRGVIVGQWDTVTGSERSWMFAVENSGPQLTMWLSANGSGFETVNSGVNITANKDYYVGASVSFSPKQVVFYVQNITDAGALQVVTQSITSASIHQDDRLTISGVAGGANDFGGVIDEVRLTRSALPAEQLLIAKGPSKGCVVVIW